MKQPKYNKIQTGLNKFIKGDLVDVDEVGGNDYLMRFKDKSLKKGSVKGE